MSQFSYPSPPRASLLKKRVGARVTLTKPTARTPEESILKTLHTDCVGNVHLTVN